jgi:hypothetical protein
LFPAIPAARRGHDAKERIMTRYSIVGLAAIVAMAGAAQGHPYRPGTKHAAAARPPRLPQPPSNPTDGPGWSDNFDSYTNGAQLIGQGGWEGWPGYANNNPTGFASNAHAASAPNSLRLALADPTATPPTDQSDFVHRYTISGGHWAYKIKTYMPSTAVATTAPYFILLCGYPTFDWSVQVHFDKNTGAGQVFADKVGGPGGTGGQPTDPPINIIYDQWVELRVDIDLDSGPNGLYNVTYGGTPVITGADWNLGFAPPYTLQAVDLYDDGIDQFYYDDASLAAVSTSTCYANCDGSTTVPFLNVNDFVCFQGLFAAGNSLANCDHSTSPPVLNISDFVCFQSAFAAGCSAP